MSSQPLQFSEAGRSLKDRLAETQVSADPVLRLLEMQNLSEAIALGIGSANLLSRAIHQVCYGSSPGGVLGPKPVDR